jgi:hypothetical protein
MNTQLNALIVISKTVKWNKYLYFVAINKYKNPDENSSVCHKHNVTVVL